MRATRRWDEQGRRVASAHGRMDGRELLPWWKTQGGMLATAYDYDGGRVLAEKHQVNPEVGRPYHVAYVHGPMGVAARMVLNLAWQAYEPQTCVRWMLADGQGNTAAAGDENGAVAIQHFDAFGVALDAVAVSGCRAASLPDLAAAGDAGYRGQEGYRTHLTDPDAAPNQGPPQRSTGLMLLGARDYDPVLGRFMEPDPTRYDPSAVILGQSSRWAYCGNDPVNASDPTGMVVATAVAPLLSWLFDLIVTYFVTLIGSILLRSIITSVVTSGAAACAVAKLTQEQCKHLQIWCIMGGGTDCWTGYRNCYLNGRWDKSRWPLPPNADPDRDPPC